MSAKVAITAVVLTKNEEAHIATCLESIAWCDELLVIDDDSSDRTLSIAKEYRATIHPRELKGDFSSQRNFGLDKARNQWVLFIDADEIVSDNLREEILTALHRSTGSTNGYYFRRHDVLWGKKITHGEVGSVRLLRLGNKSVGEWKNKVHEVWKIQGGTEELKYPLLHYPHINIQEFVRKVDSYSTVRAEELVKEKIPVTAFDVALYPLIKFIQNYLFRLGFLDGVPGLLVAVTMSFHSFLVRSKVYLRHYRYDKEN